MLQLSGTMINRPVMSLRTSTQVATALNPIINPNNLKIEGFYCQDSAHRKKELILLQQDIRDIIPQGIVVNDHDVLTEPDELVRLKDLIRLNFILIGKHVVTVDKRKLGKVSDFAVDVDSLYIQKIYVTQSLMHSFVGGSLGIDRSQIVEITDKKIVISELEQKVPAHAGAVA